MSDILKDAIADAKAIRATALANARIALEEAFAPQLQRLISDKIQYEADEEGEEDAIEAPADEVPAEEPVAEPAPEEVPAEEPVAEVPAEEPAPEVEVEPGTEEEEPVDEKIQKFGLTGPQKGFKEVVQFGGKVTPDAGNDPEAAAGKNPSVPGGKEDTIAQAMKEGEGDGLDLESIIKELEAEVGEPEEEIPDELSEEKKEEEKEEEEEEEKEEEKNEVVQFGGKVTKDAGNDPEGEKGTNPSVPGGKEDMKPVMESGEEVVDIDEILAELEAEDAAFASDDVAAQTKPTEYEQINALKSELANVNTQLSEHKKVVVLLKNKLSEVNLLNSKLLFTNKLFKTHNLNNSQKMKVIENFDRARNIREVKLVYATIAESLSQTDLVKKSKPAVKKITEGMASKTVASTKPAVEKVVKESSIIDDGSAARLKKLAGIK